MSLAAMWSVLPSIIVLGLAAAAAVVLARRRSSPGVNTARRLSVSHALAFATGFQTIHFIEEAATGFDEKFPALLGFPAMSFVFFAGFNITWIVIWMASVRGVRTAHTGAMFAAWFLAIAGMINGIGHPLMALAVGAYFPGLVSAPIVGAACAWLWLKLRAATVPREAIGGN
jgi:hypothetical protein